MCCTILTAKGVIHDNCMVFRGDLGVLPQKIVKIYSSIRAILGISEQSWLDLEHINVLDQSGILGYCLCEIGILGYP